MADEEQGWKMITLPSARFKEEDFNDEDIAPKGDLDVDLPKINLGENEDKDDKSSIDDGKSQGKKSKKVVKEVFDEEIEDDEEVSGENEDQDQEDEEDASGKSKISPKAKRIKQLLDEREELRRQLQEKDSLLTEKEKAYKSQDIVIGESKLNEIKEAIKNVKNSLRKAKNEDDQEQEIELSLQLNRLAIDEAAINAYITSKKSEKEEETKTSASKNTTQQTQEIPPIARKWAAKNSWFLEDEDMTLVARNIGARLVRDGYSDKDQDFYDELTKQMKKSFPHKFDKSGDNSVELDQDSSNTNEGTEKKKVGSEKRDSNSPRQIVSSNNGNSRSQNNNNNSSRVRLTASEQDMAQRFGMSLEQYALQKKRTETADSRGYVTIQTGR